MHNFSNILYDLLQQRGLTQRTLAEMAHTTEATISRYLTNSDRMPRVDLVASIAQALNVSTDYLLGLTSVPNRQSFTDEISSLISCYNKANDNDRKVIWAVLDKYKDSNIKIAASGQDKWRQKDTATRQEAVKKFEGK